MCGQLIFLRAEFEKREKQEKLAQCFWKAGPVSDKRAQCRWQAGPVSLTSWPDVSDKLAQCLWQAVPLALISFNEIILIKNSQTAKNTISSQRSSKCQKSSSHHCYKACVVDVAHMQIPRDTNQFQHSFSCQHTDRWLEILIKFHIWINTLMVMAFQDDTPYEGSCTSVMLPNNYIAAYVQTHGI